MLSVPDNVFLRGSYLLFRRYLRHRVGTQSAALAFYLLFSLFPFLIFISALLGQLQLDVAEILRVAEQLLPGDVVSVMEMYLTHVSAVSNSRLLLFGLVFSVYFPMRATNALMRSVRTAYHLGPPRGAIRHILKTLLYTVMLIAAVLLTLTLMTVGDRLLHYAVEQLRLPEFAAVLWVRLRFPVVAAVGYFALFFLYALAQDAWLPWKNLWPGTLAALGAWLGLSWGYSLYVERFADYSVLYGSIGTVIVLLVWLNLTATVLIMGAEVNGVLVSLRKDCGKAGSS